MMLSREHLLQQARLHSYKPETLEKVHRLLATLEQLSQVPYLKNRVVLKGGTALNLFHFDGVPRLSVDIDLNYIGQLNRADMLAERPLINDAIEQILRQHHFERYRNPSHHAGGKMVWRYASVLGQKGNLEIDLNYMYRQPLLPIQWQRPRLENVGDFEFPVLDIHELAAGKLAALMARTASRDLYEAHYLLTKSTLNTETLRFAFVIYLAMTQLSVAKMTSAAIHYNEQDLRNRLLPVLRQKNLPRTKSAMSHWAGQLVEELQLALGRLLPLRDNEKAFIHTIRRAGIIDPSMVTDEPRLQAIVKHHPALQWAAQRDRRVLERHPAI